MQKAGGGGHYCYQLTYSTNLLLDGLWLVDLICMPPPPCENIFHYPCISPLDVDECCNELDSCDHNCHDVNGSYYCSCDEGYDLNDNGYTCDGKS